MSSSLCLLDPAGKHNFNVTSSTKGMTPGHVAEPFHVCPTERAESELALCSIAFATQEDVWCWQEGEACQIFPELMGRMHPVASKEATGASGLAWWLDFLDVGWFHLCYSSARWWDPPHVESESTNHIWISCKLFYVWATVLDNNHWGLKILKSYSCRSMI